MAVELCSDNTTATTNATGSTGISPRISFSHDFCLSDIVPNEHQHPFRSNSIGSSIDFNFCTRKSFDQESSLADELFSDGKIIPTEIKKKNSPAMKITDSFNSLPPPNSLCDDTSSSDSSSKKESTKEMKGDELAEDQKQSNNNNNNSKSFWRFKRSSSLNCVSGYGRSLCPLPLLSRSNSTGSSPASSSVKRVPLSNHKQQKQVVFMKSQYSSSSSSSNYQKPPLKKNYGNGVRVNPVLNVPSGNLFGLGSIFFNGKDKNRKK